LARALLADFPVLILDEPTEHLDRDTAHDLLADFRRTTAGKAVLLITHHAADAAAADTIVRLERHDR
jgi:ATP-binding cassette subfamily C protein/ATP-binding cassette subfamily C protein CydC